MVLGLTEWSPSGEPPTVFDMTTPGAWDQLIDEYAHRGASGPLRRVFEIAQAHGVQCVVKEPRYIDAEWRSQLGRFYNGAFRRYPSVCHRLHFFTRPVDPDLADLSGLQDAYRGYAILRPLPVAPVGRTMIAPPPELDDAVRCETEEDVDLFGWPFSIRAMPFISQDTQLLRCAHAALWMVLRHCSLVHGLPRRLPAEIHDAALGGVILDATITQFEPLDDPTAILALHVDSFAFVSGLDGAASRSVSVTAGVAYRTACPPIS